MPNSRTQPYIWTTWLSKILGGDSSCEWSAWYRAHYENIPKRDRSDMDGWRMKHTSLLNQTKARFEKEGSRVFLEDQNKFSLKGKVATLAGKPDLIVVGDDYMICDVKSGQPKISDRMQVMIYMYAIPLVLPQYKGVSFSGMVAYDGDHDYISPEDINEMFTSSLVGLIKRVGNAEPAQRVPSVRECRFCDLTAESCEARVDAIEVEGETDAF